MLVLTIDSRIRIESAMSPSLRAEIEELFSHDNPDRKKADQIKAALRGQRGAKAKKLFAMMKAAERAPERIETWREEDGKLSLPRGGLARLLEVLAARGERYRLIDHRTDGDASLWQRQGDVELNLRDYQRELVESALREETCLWRSPTGSGKTRAVQALAQKLCVPTLVVVWTGNLFEQWVKDCSRVLGLDENDIGIIGDGRVRLGPITIGMQQSLARRLDEMGGEGLAQKFGLVVGEEVDRFAATTFMSVIDRFPARYRIGISDDERRKDKKEFLIYDLFGGVAAKVSRKKLIEEGHVLGVEVRLVPTGFAPDWYLRVPEPQRPYVQDRLLGCMVEDAARNQTALSIAKRMVCEERNQVVIFTHRVEHARSLDADALDAFARGAYRTGLLLGGDEWQQQFEQTREGLLSGDVRLATGTYQAVAYGTNLPSVGRGIAMTPIHNNRAMVRQTMGRLCRLHDGKEDAILYVLWDERLFGKQPLVNFIRWAAKVSVLSRGEWVEGRAFLTRWDDAKDEDERGELFGG